MKNFAIKLTWVTTIYIGVFVALCQTKQFLPLIMNLYLFGVGLYLFLVYTVLHDEGYKTNKKFKDWYADHPR
jgi:multisubunit Na+/H+ antiporter MnhC subunit